MQDLGMGRFAGRKVHEHWLWATDEPVVLGVVPLPELDVPAGQPVAVASAVVVKAAFPLQVEFVLALLAVSALPTQAQ
jgi:hypothetical protein